MQKLLISFVWNFLKKKKSQNPVRNYLRNYQNFMLYLELLEGLVFSASASLISKLSTLWCFVSISVVPCGLYGHDCHGTDL